MQRFYKFRDTTFFTTVEITCSSDLCIIKVGSMVDPDEIDVTLITASHVNCSYVLTFFWFRDCPTPRLIFLPQRSSSSSLSSLNPSNGIIMQRPWQIYAIPEFF